LAQLNRTREAAMTVFAKSWQRERKHLGVMSQRACSVFSSLVLATLIAAAAHAACKSPKNICNHFDDCLQRTSDPNNKDADAIRAGVKARDGKRVRAGAEACARDLGRQRQWDGWVRGCQTLSLSQLLRWKWSSEKPFATGTHNSARLMPHPTHGYAATREAAMAAFAKSWRRE
jgi:hypothetical protein